MPLPGPQKVTSRGFGMVAAAMAEALGKPWSVPLYAQVAGNEATRHLKRVTGVKAMFQEAGAVIGRGVDKLAADTAELSKTWQDKNWVPAFEAPVTGYMEQLGKARDQLGNDAAHARGHITALGNLESAITDTAHTVGLHHTEHQERYDRLRVLQQDYVHFMEQVSGLAVEYPPPWLGEHEAWETIDRLEQLDQLGFDRMVLLDDEYRNAGDKILAAAGGIELSGPAAAEAPEGPGTSPYGPDSAPGGGPSPSLPGGVPSGGAPSGGAPAGGLPPGGAPPGGAPPGGAPPGGAPPGGAPSGGAPSGGAPPGGAPPGGAAGGDPGGAVPGGELPGGGTGLPNDTGLSGLPTAPPPGLDTPITSPASPNPGSLTPSSSAPGGIGGVGGLGGVGSSGIGGSSQPSSGSGNPAVTPAARRLSAPSTANSGQAPTLAGGSTGAPGTSSPGRYGGVPPMVPPIAPMTGAGAGGGKPGSGAAPPTGAGRNRPAGPAAGVPAGLRGRGAPRDPQATRPASPRARRGDSQAEELLDSELWEVERPNPAQAEQSSHQSSM